MSKDILAGVVKGEPRTLLGQEVALPILYRRLDAFFALYGADAGAVRAVLPSPRLRPVPVWPGRVALTLNAFNYYDTDIGPYGEFSVGVPCRTMHLSKNILGVFVLRLPVTSELALEGGKLLWGYPKFLCSMDFQSSAAEHRVRLSQEGRLILDLRVARSGPGLGLSPTLNTFTVKDGDLIRTSIAGQGVYRAMPQGLAELATGPEEMGVQLSRLGLGARPLVTGEMLDGRMVLPEGENIGSV
jgi:hypothetical protein